MVVLIFRCNRFVFNEHAAAGNDARNGLIHGACLHTVRNCRAPPKLKNMVTKTIEGAVSSVSGVKTLTSQSSEGTSLVMAEFSSGTDGQSHVSDMESNIDLIKSVLPTKQATPWFKA